MIFYDIPVIHEMYISFQFSKLMSYQKGYFEKKNKCVLHLKTKDKYTYPNHFSRSFTKVLFTYTKLSAVSSCTSL